MQLPHNLELKHPISKDCKKRKKEARNLGDSQFRAAYKKLLETAKNHKKRVDKEWAHKSLCFYHKYYPMARQFFSEQAMPESMWRMCQCGIYDDMIKQQCGNFKYRIGLNEIIKKGEGSQKKAHYADLDIAINGQHWTVQLLTMQAGEIKKITQPTTRKQKLGTCTFHDGRFIMCFDEKYFIEWKLKQRCCKELVKVKREQTRADVADFWYQAWAVHGLLEEKEKNMALSRFVAIHNNKFVEGTSREACEKRIVLYVYSVNGEDFDLTINGKRPKCFSECQDKKKRLEQDRRDRLKNKRKRKLSHMLHQDTTRDHDEDEDVEVSVKVLKTEHTDSYKHNNNINDMHVDERELVDEVAINLSQYSESTTSMLGASQTSSLHSQNMDENEHEQKATCPSTSWIRRERSKSPSISPSKQSKDEKKNEFNPTNHDTKHAHHTNGASVRNGNMKINGADFLMLNGEMVHTNGTDGGHGTLPQRQREEQLLQKIQEQKQEIERLRRKNNELSAQIFQMISSGLTGPVRDDNNNIVYTPSQGSISSQRLSQASNSSSTPQIRSQPPEPQIPAAGPPEPARKRRKLDSGQERIEIFR